MSLPCLQLPLDQRTQRTVTGVVAKELSCAHCAVITGELVHVTFGDGVIVFTRELPQADL